MNAQRTQLIQLFNDLNWNWGVITAATAALFIVFEFVWTTAGYKFST